MEGADIAPPGDGGDGREGGHPYTAASAGGFGGLWWGRAGGTLGQAGGTGRMPGAGRSSDPLLPPSRLASVGWEGGRCTSVSKKVSRLKRHRRSF